MPESASQLAPGATFGRYVLVEAIGRGAMGEVWVAIDPDLDRKVALKLLRADRSARPQDRARLDGEARAMARLTHPNVVSIHDVGALGDQLFIAMEFVAGETLEHWIARGPQPVAEVLAIMTQAGTGLAAAHREGLVHRDFKPANVIIDHAGRVRVLDFGLARPGNSLGGSDGFEDSIGSEGSNRVGTRRTQGTPAYMAPEQHRGGVVDARSDIFAFCVTLFEALYGHRPFAGPNRLSVALTIVEGRMTEPSAEARAGVPEWIHAIVRRGLATDPNQRFRDMDELLAALARSPQRRRQRWIAAGIVALGVVGLVGLVVSRNPTSEDEPCANTGEAITEYWSPELRAGLRGRVDAITDRPPLAGQRLVEGLDRYVDQWQAASVQLCRDRRARRLTDRLRAIREACLAEHHAGLGALLERTSGEAEADASVLAGVAAHPFAAVRALGDPSRCVDLPAFTVPASAERYADRAALELALDVGTQPASGLVAEVQPATDAELDEDPELALLLGRVAQARGDRADAEARLHASASVSAGVEPELAAQAWLALVELELDGLTGAGAEPTEPTASLERATELLAYADALLPAHELATRARLGVLAGRVALLDRQAATPGLLDASIDAYTDEPIDAADLLIAMLELRAELDERSGRSSADDRARAERLRRSAFGSD